MSSRTANAKSQRKTKQRYGRTARRIPRFESLEDRRLLTVFVDALDTTPDGGGCGSFANPCDTIQAGVDAAPAGSEVYVVTGSYSETVTITKDLTLRGESAGLVEIDPMGAFNGIDITGPVDVVLQDIEVTDADIGIRAVGARSLELDGVDASMNTRDGLTALGVDELKIQDSTFSDNGLNGVTVDTFTDFEVRDVTVLDNGAYGLDAAFGERVHLTGVNFADNGLDGAALDSISTAFGTAIEIEDILSSGNGGDGLEVTRSGTAEIDDGFFDGNMEDGMFFSETDSITVDDVLSKSNGGAGVYAKSSGSFHDRNGSYFDNDEHGLDLVDTSATVTLESTSSLDNDGDDDGTGDGAHIHPEDAAMGATDLFILGGEFNDTDGAGAAKNQVNGINALMISGKTTIADSLVGGVEHVTATGNSATGIFLGEGGLAQIGDAIATANFGGISILAYGSVAVENVTASVNTVDGLEIDMTPVAVVKGGDYSANGGDGIFLGGIGMALVENGGGLTADLNAISGLAVMGIGELKVKGGTFNGNAAEGIDIAETVVAELTTGVTAVGNLTGVKAVGLEAFVDQDGVYTDNADHGIFLEDTLMFVELTRTTANDNDANGDGTGDGVHAAKDMAPVAVDGVFVVQGGRFNDTDGGAGGKSQRNGIFVDKVAVDLVVVPAMTPTSPLDLPEAKGNREDGLIGTGGMNAFVIGGTFDLNADEGVELHDFTGVVDVVGVDANLNSGNGLEYSSGGAVIGIDDSTFGGNLNGVKVTGAMDLLLNDSSANLNSEMGVSATGTATFGDTNGSYNENGDHGIQLIDAMGIVALEETTARDNDKNTDLTGDGVHIQSTAGTALAGDLIVTKGSYGSSSFTTQQRGVFVESISGVAAIAEVTASGNLAEGLRIVEGGTGVDVSFSLFSMNGADGSHISDTFFYAGEANTYSGNASNGLHLNDVSGGISLSTITSEMNAGVGILIEDAGSLTTGHGIAPLVINVGAVGSNNHGLRVVNQIGDVFIDDVAFLSNDADNNDIGDGAHFTSTLGNPNAIEGSLFVTGTTFRGDDSVSTGHQEKGLYVDSISGGVFVVDSSAVGNDRIGVDIEDGGAAVPYNGVATGDFAGVVSGGRFNDNGDEGLRLNEMTGSTLLQNFEANDNGDEGVEVDASFDIEVLNVTANRNLLDGLDIESSLDVTIDGGEFTENADNGIHLLSVDEVGIFNVTVLDSGNIAVAALTSGIRVAGATSLDISNNDVRGSEMHGIEVTSVPTLGFLTSAGNVEDALTIDHAFIEHGRNGILQDRIRHTGIASLTVNTVDSDDSISVTFGPSLPTITLTGGEQGFVDELSVIRDMPTDVVTVTSSTVTDGTSSITYSEIERVVVDEGDFSFDGDIDGVDIDWLVAAIASGENSPAFELTGDRFVDGDDLDVWLSIAGAANLPSGAAFLPGDANLDGAVDLADLHIWNVNKSTAQAAWTKGDFDANGIINEADFRIWNANRFSNSNPTNLSDQGEAGLAWNRDERGSDGESREREPGRLVAVADLVFAALREANE